MSDYFEPCDRESKEVDESVNFDKAFSFFVIPVAHFQLPPFRNEQLDSGDFFKI